MRSSLLSNSRLAIPPHTTTTMNVDTSLAAPPFGRGALRSGCHEFPTILADLRARFVPTRVASLASPRHRSVRRAPQEARASHVPTANVPVLAYRQRGPIPEQGVGGDGPGEIWHEARGDGRTRFSLPPCGRRLRAPGDGRRGSRAAGRTPRRVHRQTGSCAVQPDDAQADPLPCYGMQWGAAVYLYPVEENYVEKYVRPPTPQQRIEARMFGGVWSRQGASTCSPGPPLRSATSTSTTC